MLPAKFYSLKTQCDCLRVHSRIFKIRLPLLLIDAVLLLADILVLDEFDAHSYT